MQDQRRAHAMHIFYLKQKETQENGSALTHPIMYITIYNHITAVTE